MAKFFLQKRIKGNDGFVEIEGEDFHHIRDVLRMRPGERIQISDMDGRDFLCEIKSCGKEAVKLVISERSTSNREPGYKIHLFQGMVKSDKMDYIIQKSVELGVSSITPVTCERSLSGIEKNAEKKIIRWNKIALSAAKQCARSVVPKVQYPVSFDCALERMSKSHLCFIPWECETQRGLKYILREFREKSYNTQTNEISFLTGPEGGISLLEIEKIKSRKIPMVTLGKRILRTETAAVAVLAMALYEFEL